MRFPLQFLLLLPGVLAADSTRPDLALEQGDLDGAWVLVNSTTIVWTIKGRHLKIHSGGKQVNQGIVHLDNTYSPNRLDINFHSHWFYGIYKIDNGKLHYEANSNVRPVKFNPPGTSTLIFQKGAR